MSVIRENWPALVGVGLFVGLIGLYVLELRYLFNTIEFRRLLLLSWLLMAFVLGGVLWRYRARFMPWGRHFPLLAIIVVPSMLFAPLFGSLLNRVVARSEYQTFQFINERAFVTSGYGFIEGQEIKPSEWRLWVQEGAKTHQFKYKSQAYFPISQPGETIQLPVRRGLLTGIRVVTLK
jgi:hypothetical protein